MAAAAAVLLTALNSALIGLLIAVSAQEVFEAQTLANFFPVSHAFFCVAYSYRCSSCPPGFYAPPLLFAAPPNLWGGRSAWCLGRTPTYLSALEFARLGSI